MNLQNSIFKRPVLIGYLVKELKALYPDKQIGKTVVQKMLFLLTRKGVLDFNYSMYHYGPYSYEVNNELDFAENSDIVEIKWLDNQGFFIQPSVKLEEFEVLLAENEKQNVQEVIQKFGEFSAKELSIIATALFLKDNFNVSDEDVSKTVQTVKPNFSLEYIDNLLKRSLSKAY